jgi:nitrilase
MASTPDWPTNLDTVRTVLAQHVATGDLAVFPECVLCLGRGESVRDTARSPEEAIAELGLACREAERAAVFGGVPIREVDGVRNSSLAFSASGKLLARYDKIHLFRLDPDTPGGIDESRVYSAGAEPIVLDFQGWRIGLSICYDLRFPELFRAWGPVDAAICTAAFTAATGLAHWEVLLRARAIENQCYVAAAGQCGTNTETHVEHYGHSMVIDPWGQIRGQAGEGEGVLRVELDPDRLHDIRTKLPALQHRVPGLSD